MKNINKKVTTNETKHVEGEKKLNELCIVLILHKYITNIYLCWEFAVPNTTLLSISGHFKRFQLNDPLSQLTNMANIF